MLLPYFETNSNAAAQSRPQVVHTKQNAPLTRRMVLIDAAFAGRWRKRCTYA
jgi:hypothetical protein